MVITDGYPELPINDSIANVPIIRLRHVKHFPPRDLDEIAHTISKIDPDVTLWLMGLTSFFQRALYKRLNHPIVALVGSSAYWRYEVLRNVGVSEIIHELGLLATSFAETFSPRFLIRKTFNLDSVKLVVTLSRENKKRLELIGVKSHKLVYIPTGVDPYFLQLPSKKEVDQAKIEACEDYEKFLVTYFGPPLLTRGVDTLFRATKFALEKYPFLQPNLRLLILSRASGEKHEVHEKHMLKLLDSLNINGVVKFKKGFLSKHDLKSYLTASDLIVLPFKYVLSDAPLGVMEAMSLGKLVLSTNVDGIPELLEDSHGLVIKPNDFRRLGEIIAYFSKNKKELKKYGSEARRQMLLHSTWKDSALKMLQLLESVCIT